jgi:hypothetical protein
LSDLDLYIELSEDSLKNNDMFLLHFTPIDVILRIINEKQKYGYTPIEILTHMDIVNNDGRKTQAIRQTIYNHFDQSGMLQNGEKTELLNTINSCIRTEELVQVTEH